MKTKKILILAVTALTIFSCSKEQLSDSVKNSDLETQELEGNSSISGLALDKFRLWENGSTLKIKFLGGSDYVQGKVMEYAKQWEEYANIKFEEVSDDDADIKISFVLGSSWSYVGTNAKYYDIDGATMNYGWFNDSTSDSEFSRTTIHEFGHALGAIHEHQSPEADIQWNKPVVYEYYESRGWDRDEIDYNIFYKYDSSQTLNSEYDTNSIMHYYIDPSFTLNGVGVTTNYYLSETDKAFISEAYPFNDDSDEVTVGNENLAYGKVAEQSSIHEDLPGEASRAIDGDTSGRWSLGSITRTKTEYRPWWQVKLEKDYPIGEIKIWNRTDGCCAYKLDNFDVFVYDADGDLNYKTTIKEVPSPYVIINAGGAMGSRIRVKLKDENQLSIAEVEIFEY